MNVPSQPRLAVGVTGGSALLEKLICFMRTIAEFESLDRLAELAANA